MFYLAYHLHWSHSEAMALDPAERRAFLHLLGEQLEREQEAMRRSQRSQ